MFVAVAQLTGHEIIELVTADPRQAVLTSPQPAPAVLPAAAPARSRNAPAQRPRPATLSPPVETSHEPVPKPESPEAAAERERLYRQIMGIPDPKPRRRWRR